jgi:hypothetical protein
MLELLSPQGEREAVELLAQLLAKAAAPSRPGGRIGGELRTSDALRSPGLDGLIDADLGDGEEESR